MQAVQEALLDAQAEALSRALSPARPHADAAALRASAPAPAGNADGAQADAEQAGAAAWPVRQLAVGGAAWALDRTERLANSLGMMAAVVERLNAAGHNFKIVFMAGALLRGGAAQLEQSWGTRGIPVYPHP